MLKYRRMRHIAAGGAWDYVETGLIMFGMLIIFAVVLAVIFTAVSINSHLNLIANASQNISHISGLSNYTASAILGLLAGNQTRSNAFFLQRTTYTYAQTNTALILVLLAMITVLMTVFFSNDTELSHLSTYRKIQRFLKYKETEVLRLRGAGFTEAEIAWYFAMRSALSSAI